MNRFDWKWYLSDLKPDKDVKVFSTFSCGGGSSMGYKRAGFQVIGNVEIDPKINAMYCRNNHPKYNFCMDLREFNKLEDLPEELHHLDILDGSPPCTTFSMAGKREKTWGQKKRFREGQAEQTLDDLFFVFLDTVEKLRPKIVIAENVEGMINGNAKGYINLIAKKFREIGYDVQLFNLNSAYMDVPQNRKRIFFVANNQNFSKISMSFQNDLIRFGECRSVEGKSFPSEKSVIKKLADEAQKGERRCADVAKRLAGTDKNYFTTRIVADDEICQTVMSNGAMIRLCDRVLLSDEDFRNVQTFPQDYDFCGNDVQYVCGMSVPPNMMANIATEVWEQWLKK